MADTLKSPCGTIMRSVAVTEGTLKKTHIDTARRLLANQLQSTVHASGIADPARSFVAARCNELLDELLARLEKIERPDARLHSFVYLCAQAWPSIVTCLAPAIAMAAGAGAGDARRLQTFLDAQAREIAGEM